MTLLRKVNGTFREVSSKRPTLGPAADPDADGIARSAYSTTFTRPPAGTCRVTSRFEGDAIRLGSEASKTFAC